MPRICRRQPGAKGELAIYVPAEFKPVAAGINGEPGSWKKARKGVVRLQLSFPVATAQWSMRFET